MHLTLFIKILTLDALKEDQVITEEETIELLESNRHALIGEDQLRRVSKLMLTRWRSQPIGIRKRQPTPERLQSISSLFKNVTPESNQHNLI